MSSVAFLWYDDKNETINQSPAQASLNNWLAVQNLRIALKKAVFALGFKKTSVITFDAFVIFVDDTFVIFQNEKELEEFLIKLNGLHSSLQFTFEKEKNNSLPFLDVQVELTKGSYETKVYRKPIRSQASTYAGNPLRR